MPPRKYKSYKNIPDIINRKGITFTISNHTKYLDRISIFKKALKIDGHKVRVVREGTFRHIGCLIKYKTR